MNRRLRTIGANFRDPLPRLRPETSDTRKSVQDIKDERDDAQRELRRLRSDYISLKEQMKSMQMAAELKLDAARLRDISTILENLEKSQRGQANIVKLAL
jgi:septal ring factor EnvC (AmiA/AmiB activator)